MIGAAVAGGGGALATRVPLLVPVLAEGGRGGGSKLGAGIWFCGGTAPAGGKELSGKGGLVAAGGGVFSAT